MDCASIGASSGASKSFRTKTKTNAGKPERRNYASVLEDIYVLVCSGSARKLDGVCAKASADVPAPMAQPVQQRIVVVEPIRVFDPFFAYPYPYAYSPDYMSANFGYVKIKTDSKDASVYIDGGFADKVEKAKKFALRPGNHGIELRDSDGRTLYKERVAVTVGKTTELRAG
jgi:hypothetical protein